MFYRVSTPKASIFKFSRSFYIRQDITEDPIYIEKFYDISDSISSILQQKMSIIFCAIEILTKYYKCPFCSKDIFLVTYFVPTMYTDFSTVQGDHNSANFSERIQWKRRMSIYFRLKQILQFNQAEYERT